MTFVHATNAGYQHAHPIVQNGTIRVCPGFRAEYFPSDSTKDPFFYYIPGQNDAQLARNLADAIGQAKQSGKRIIIEIAGSGKIWLYLTTEYVNGSMGSPDAVMGELTNSGGVTAVRSGVFIDTSETSRLNPIILAACAILDSDYAGARPDGVFRDIEYSPLADVSGRGTMRAMMFADPVIAEQVAILRVAGVDTDDHALDILVNQAVYATCANQDQIWGSVKTYVWGIGQSLNPLHTFNYLGSENAYPVPNATSGHRFYMSSTSTETDELLSDLGAADASKPFSGHVALPGTFSGNNTLQQLSDRLNALRSYGQPDAFVFIGDSTIASAGASDTAGVAVLLTTAAQYLLGPTAELVGREAGMLFSGVEGSGIGTTMYGRVIEENIEMDFAPVDRFYDVSERLSLRNEMGTVTVSYTFGNMAPVPPSGTSAVLILYEDAARTRGTVYSNAIMEERNHSSSTEGASDPQKLSLVFRITSTGVAGTLPVVSQ